MKGMVQLSSVVELIRLLGEKGREGRAYHLQLHNAVREVVPFRCRWEMGCIVVRSVRWRYVHLSLCDFLISLCFQICNRLDKCACIFCVKK